MIRKHMTSKERKLEKVYEAHATDIYRLCLHYLKNEERAASATKQVFFNFFMKTDEKDFKDVFGILVHEAMQIICGEQNHEYVDEEVRE